MKIRGAAAPLFFIMNKKQYLLYLLVFAFLLPSPALCGAQDSWKDWVAEVRPIMSDLELKVFKLLQTEEDRLRFRELFWQARDPEGKSAHNSFRREYQRRLAQVRNRYNGPQSDRGRIYLLLGPPLESKSFSGHERLVECELWFYGDHGRKNLPPHFQLIFFRQRDMGDFQLFHPGVHSAHDLLSPYAAINARNPRQAYQAVMMDSAELALASLSVIPGEGDPALAMQVTSSSLVINNIISLPERESTRGYVLAFNAAHGLVEVEYSTAEIGGRGELALSRKQGLAFLDYAVMPDRLLKDSPAGEAGRQVLDLVFYLRVEDQQGRLVYQQEILTPLAVESEQQDEIRRRKMVFRGFVPIIEGDFNVTVSFSNRSRDEFYTFHRRLVYDEKSLPVLTGFQIREVERGQFISFGMGPYLVLADPRAIYSQQESLVGLVSSESRPQVELLPLKAGLEAAEASVTAVPGEDRLYRFELELAAVTDGNYSLRASTKDGRIWSEPVHVMPRYFNIQRPLAMEKTEPLRSRENQLFILAQEHLNLEDSGRALEILAGLPTEGLGGQALEVFARAHYLHGNFEKVIEILERPGLEKTYPLLLLLANSAIKLQQLKAAVTYLEQLLRYGENEGFHSLLAAAHNGLGNTKRAEFHRERARELKAGDRAKPERP